MPTSATAVSQAGTLINPLAAAQLQAQLQPFSMAQVVQAQAQLAAASQAALSGASQHQQLDYATLAALAASQNAALASAVHPAGKEF